MSSEWNETTVGDFCPFSYGKALPERDRKYGIFPVISSAGFVGVHNNHLVNKPGVVIGRKGTVGNVTYSENPFWAIDTAFYVADEPEIRDIRFVYFMLKTLGLNQMNSDSAVPGLNRDNAHALPIVIPPIQIQREIADHLQMLDDRITLLLETNTTLEAIAQALFKSWFVDFDPVRAKQEGREPEGMDADTAALFPDSFEESELGLVPKGWRIDNIYASAHLIYGAPFSSSKFNSKGIGKPLIRIRDLKDEAPGVFTPEVHPKGYLVKPGDIVVGMDGEFRAYLWGGDSAWLNQRVCVFMPKTGFPATFIHQIIIPILSAVEASETATTVIHLGKNDIDRFRILIPNEPVLEAFGKLSDPVYKKIVEQKQIARTLTALRDTLLPRLISGQLRIPEAETLIEEASA